LSTQLPGIGKNIYYYSYVDKKDVHINKKRYCSISFLIKIEPIYEEIESINLNLKKFETFQTISASKG